MRIISGKFKGRRLVSFDEEHIRPTTDRVKESVFNILAAYLDGASVLDLFSGTGNLGIESLSRGAASVDMVEANRRSLEIIGRNLELLKVTEGVKVHKSDVITFLKHYKGAAFDIVLIDPPFPAKICLETLETLSDSPALTPQTQIMIEHSSHEPLPDVVKKLRRVDTREYGDKIVSFYEQTSEAT